MMPPIGLSPEVAATLPGHPMTIPTPGPTGIHPSAADVRVIRAWADAATREHQQRSHAVLDMPIDERTVAELRELLEGRPLMRDARVRSSRVLAPLASE